MTNSGLGKRSSTFMALLIGVTFGALGTENPAASKPDCVDCGAGMKLCAKSIAVNNKAYLVDAIYPYLVEASGAPALAFNDLVSKKVLKQLPTQKDIDEALNDKESLERGQSKEELRYTVQPSDGSTLSILCEHFSFGAGAAHPTSETISINWSIQESRDLALSDIFESNSKYLDRISASCIKQLLANKELMAATDAESIKRGAGPDAKNFSVWAVTKDGILIKFAEYQLGPRPAGTPEVTVPWSSLGDIKRKVPGK